MEGKENIIVRSDRQKNHTHTLISKTARGGGVMAGREDVLEGEYPYAQF